MATVRLWTGKETRALREALRLSARAFADFLGVSARTVASWDARGTGITPRPEMQEALDTALAKASDQAKSRFTDALAEPIPGLSRQPGESPTEHRPEDDVTDLPPYLAEILFGAQATSAGGPRAEELIPAVQPEPPRRVGEADVARIEATTSVFRDWDNRWGCGLSRNVVVAQLQFVAATAEHAVCSSTSTKSRLLTALADLAGVAAFLCYDGNHHPQARALWYLGLRAGGEAGNADLISTTLRQLAHQALHLGRHDEALRLVRLAYAATVHPAHHVSELALAEIAAFEGWCHAAEGRTQPCHRALSRSQEHFANADGEEAPPWLAHLDRAELAALCGHSYHVLATSVPEVVDRATALLREAIDGRSGGYARSKTLNLIALSATYFHEGEHIDQGISVGDQALQGAGTLTSPRALDRLRLLQPLAEQHQDRPGVRDFQARLATVLADA